MFNEDVKEDLARYWLLEFTTLYWPPLGLGVINHHPLGLAIQTIYTPPHSANSACISFMSIIGEIVGALVKSK